MCIALCIAVRLLVEMIIKKTLLNQLVIFMVLHDDPFYPSHYLMGTHGEPALFINSLLIMKKERMLFALLFYVFWALRMNVYCNVYCRMRCYGWREQVKRQGAKILRG